MHSENTRAATARGALRFSTKMAAERRAGKIPVRSGAICGRAKKGKMKCAFVEICCGVLTELPAPLLLLLGLLGLEGAHGRGLGGLFF